MQKRGILRDYCSIGLFKVLFFIFHTIIISLTHRFNNLNRKRSSEREIETPKKEKISNPTSPTPEMLSIQNKMKIMQNDEIDSMDLWHKTFALRSTDIKASATLHLILDGWPFFKQSGAEKFVRLLHYVNYPVINI